MTLATAEFIRRFLVHVLPRASTASASYGLFANGYRAENIAKARDLLAVATAKTKPEAASTQQSDRAAASATPMPLLRRPHDHHRGLCTRRHPTYRPQPQSSRSHRTSRADTKSERQQIRISGPPPVLDRPLVPLPQFASVASDRAPIALRRISPSTATRQIGTYTPAITRLPIAPAPHNPRGAPAAHGLNPHSARRTASRSPPAISFLGASRTPGAPLRWHCPCTPASETLHNSRPETSEAWAVCSRQRTRLSRARSCDSSRSRHSSNYSRRICVFLKKDQPTLIEFKDVSPILPHGFAGFL